MCSNQCYRHKCWGTDTSVIPQTCVQCYRHKWCAQTLQWLQQQEQGTHLYLWWRSCLSLSGPQPATTQRPPGTLHAQHMCATRPFLYIIPHYITSACTQPICGPYSHVLSFSASDVCMTSLPCLFGSSTILSTSITMHWCLAQTHQMSASFSRRWCSLASFDQGRAVLTVKTRQCKLQLDWFILPYLILLRSQRNLFWMLSHFESIRLAISKHKTSNPYWFPPIPRYFKKTLPSISQGVSSHVTWLQCPAHRELNGTATAALNPAKKRFQHFAPNEVVGLMQHFQRIYKVSKQLNDAKVKPCVQTHL